MIASIVVPAYNAEKTLAACLRSLRGQDFEAPFETIIVDDGSQDLTAQIAESLGVTVVRQKNGGAAAARNAGLRRATGTWVAFTDADCLPARSWLRSLVAAAEKASTAHPAVGAAGKTIGFESRTPAARFCDIAGSLDAERHLSHPRFPFAPSCNVMYRKSVMLAVGGFDERYATYEACDLHSRVVKFDDGPFVYEPRALVLHRHREDWKSFWRQQYNYGIGYAQFIRHHRDECDWTLADELREWGEIGRLGLVAWQPPKNDELLYQRGTFVKKVAQRLGFIKARLDPHERQRW